MKVLLVYPSTPVSFFSYPKLLHRMGCKAFMPPLSLLTVAALLPREWQVHLVDLNVEPVNDRLWAWADLVMTSGMIIQRPNMLALAVPPAKMPLRRKLRDYDVFLVFSWRLGIIFFTRWQYWRQLLSLAKRNPGRLMGYLASCARGEQMFYLRDLLRQPLTGAQGQ